MLTLRQVGRSAGLYPITLIYIGGVVLIVAVASALITPLIGVGVLAFVCILGAFYATWRELRFVHKMVDGQRTELLSRIDQLSNLLTDSGVVVPTGTKAEQDARDDTIRKGLT